MFVQCNAYVHFSCDTYAPVHVTLLIIPLQTAVRAPAEAVGWKNKFIPPKEQICQETQTSKVTSHKLRDLEMPWSRNPYVLVSIHIQQKIILYIFGEQIVGWGWLQEQFFLRSPRRMNLEAVIVMW